MSVTIDQRHIEAVSKVGRRNASTKVVFSLDSLSSSIPSERESGRPAGGPLGRRSRAPVPRPIDSQDIRRLIPTAGAAFAVSVTDQSFTERKKAGRALMKEILTLVQLRHEGEAIVASIGGFGIYAQRLAEARCRLASYQSRGERAFAFADELADKRRQLVEIERALALDVESGTESNSVAA